MVLKEKIVGILKYRKKYDEFIDKASDIGIDLYSVEPLWFVDFLFDDYVSIFFDGEGLDLIDWWLYEKDEKKLYNKETGELIADLTTPEALINYLFEHHLDEDGRQLVQI